ncbi:MAG: hypothetical protein HQL16_01010 [Candidatus Omnitrophica bacterium]|nr:hypothetical protein [Candidatus Omnitrophota bacterium]
MEETTYQQNENGFTLRDYIHVLFRQKDVVLLSMIIVMTIVFLGLKMETKQYEASVKMLITASKSVESPFYKEANQSRNVEQTLTQSEIVKSDPVLARVVMAQGLVNRPLDDEKRYASSLKARVINLKMRMLKRKLNELSVAQKEAFLFRRAIENLKISIRVEPIRDSDIFTITVKDYDPGEAAILANVVSRAYVIYDLEQQMAELRLKYGDKHPKVKYLQDNIEKMAQNLDGRNLSDIDAIGTASVKIVAQAYIPLEPTGASKLLIFIMAVIMSLFAGVILAFIFEYSDQAIKNPRDIERALDIPYIGSVRRKRFFNRVLVNFKKKRLSAYGHSYRSLSEHLYLLMKDKAVASLMISSTLEMEDSSAVSGNLANYFSEVLKRKVLLVDADPHRPFLHRLFNVGNEKGFVDCLEGTAEIKDAAHAVTENLSVLTAGKTALSSIILFDPLKIERVINAAKTRYDFIIFRSSSTRSHKDPSVLVRHVDGLLAVVEEGKVRKHVFVNAFSDLKGKARHTLGVILINRTYPIPGFIYERV